FISSKFIVGGTCGYVGEGEHFPAFRAGSASGGSAAGRQRRLSTYPQAFLVNLSRRAIAEALVLALVIVEIEPSANASLGFGDCRISVKVDLLVFEAAPQSLDKDVVHTRRSTRKIQGARSRPSSTRSPVRFGRGSATGPFCVHS